MRDMILEEVFRLLEEATRLEKTGQHRIEAATKYYESCYLMRQIVATAQARLDDDDDNGTEKTIGISSCRLLQDKINHYTALARKLYFDESSPGLVVVRIEDSPEPNSGPNPPQQQQQQEEEQPATSIMIGLLDDAISVLTEAHVLPPPIPPPILGHDQRNLPIARPVERKLSPVKPITNHNNHRHNSNNNPKQPLRQQHQQKPRSKIPRCALAAIDRRVQLQANLAHSILSRAIDLDERRRNPDKAIASYVEASELYLSAIQLAKQQIQKLESAAEAIYQERRRRPTASSCSSAALVETMGDCLKRLLVKLKRLLGSSLDRIEALKEEQEMLNNNNNNNACAIHCGTVGSVGSSSTILRITPLASNRSKFSKPLDYWSPVHHWFSAKENDWNPQKQNNVRYHKEPSVGQWKQKPHNHEHVKG